MSASIMIDLIIIGIIALSIFIGWKRGLMHGILSLAASILALFAASQLSDFAADLLVEKAIRPAAQSAIEERLQEMDEDIIIASPRKELENVIDAIENDLVREKAYEMLDAMEMSDEPIIITTWDDLGKASEKIVDTVLTGPVRDLISSIVCIIGFFLISGVLRPVVWMVDQAFQLPILRQANQLGGMISGAVTGILVVLVTVWVMLRVDLYLTEEMIEKSNLLNAAAQCLDSLGFGSDAIQ